jgi:hypothetical protein
VDGFVLDEFNTQRPAADVQTLKLEKVRNLTVHNSPGLADRTSVAAGDFYGN